MSQSNISFEVTGPVVPDTSEVLAAQRDIWQVAFDNKLNTDAATPQGQLMASLAALVQDKNNQLLYLANMFNPMTSEGVWQDGLGAIYFLDRKPAIPTQVQVECMGLEGVVIQGTDQVTAAEAARVRTSDGHELVCLSTGTIPAEGVITLPFACTETGPIEIEVNTVTTIVQTQPGWDSVANHEAGVLGRDVESQWEFELRRYASVALNSRSMLASVYARVGEVDDVIDLLARQNRGDNPIVDNGVTYAPHSIYIAVLGGADSDIAEAIYNSVSGGCDYNGNTAYEYTDPLTGAQETVLFQRPDEVAFEIYVTVRRSAGVNTTVMANAAANIYADFYGEEYTNRADREAHNRSVERVHIGETVYADRFICPVQSAGIPYGISVTIGRKGGTQGDVVSLRNDEYPSLVMDDIHVVLEA